MITITVKGQIFIYMIKFKQLIKNNFLEIIVFIFFILVRIPDLGHDSFNTDVWKWKARVYDFGTGVFNLDPDKTVQKYHPGVTLMWVGTFAVKAFNFYVNLTTGADPADNLISTVFGLHFTQKLFLILTLGLVFAVIFRVLKRLFGVKYGLLFLFFATTEPYFLGLTRVFHLEGLMSSFMLASFLYYYEYLVNENKKSLAISSVFGALSVLTKTSSVFIVLFIPFSNFMYTYLDNKEIKQSVMRSLKPYFKWLGYFFITCVVLWPVILTNPVLTFSTLYKGVFTVGIEGPHYQLFFGQWVEDPGPFFYPLVILFRGSPLLIIGLIMSILFRRKLFGKKSSRFILLTSLFIALYVLELTIPSKKLDRYVLPSFLGIYLISNFFFVCVVKNINKNVLYKIFALIIFIVPIIQAAWWHPNYLGYYSPLVGGLNVGMNTIEPKWLFGQNEIQNYFIKEFDESGLSPFDEGQAIDSLVNTKELNSKMTVGFQEKYYTQVWPFIEEIGGRAVIKDLTVHAKQTNYFVYPVYDDDSYLEKRFDIQYKDSIYVNNVKVFNVYKRIW